MTLLLNSTFLSPIHSTDDISAPTVRPNLPKPCVISVQLSAATPATGRRQPIVVIHLQEGTEEDILERGSNR